MSTDHMDGYRTVRLPVQEVWENGKGEFPLFICSDSEVVRAHLAEYPEDTVTTRYWVREGGAD